MAREVGESEVARHPGDMHPWISDPVLHRKPDCGSVHLRRPEGVNSGGTQEHVSVPTYHFMLHCGMKKVRHVGSSGCTVHAQMPGVGSISAPYRSPYAALGCEQLRDAGACSHPTDHVMLQPPDAPAPPPDV